MGNNLSKEGFLDTIKDITKSITPPKTAAEINADWKRLASFMRGL